MANELHIPGVIAGRPITEKEKEELIGYGKTNEILKGFWSEEKGQNFDAFLIVKKNKVQFGDIEYHNKRKQTQETDFPKSIFGKELKSEWIEDLKAGRKTELITGFEVDGKPTDGHLQVQKDSNKIVLLPPEKKQEYIVPKKIFGVLLTDKQRETLSVEGRETELISGFKDKSKNPPMHFDAHLSIVKGKEGKYEMNFKYIEKELSIKKDQEKTTSQSKSGGRNLSR